MVVALASSSNHGQSLQLFVISPSTQSERTLPSDISIAQIKERLQLITGIPAGSQKISLHAPPRGGPTCYQFTEGDLLAVLDGDDAKTLESYNAQTGHVLKVTPSDVHLGASLYSHVEDPNVQKFELTDEEYASRRDTVMAFKARNKIGRFAEPQDSSSTSSSAHNLPEGLAVGSRVKVVGKSDSGVERLGTVRYTGMTQFAGDVWIGIQYDEPVGKNDGSVDGHRYFDCPAKYGGFVRPDKCIVGDWPSEVFDLDSD